METLLMERSVTGRRKFTRITKGFAYIEISKKEFNEILYGEMVYLKVDYYQDSCYPETHYRYMRTDFCSYERNKFFRKVEFDLSQLYFERLCVL